MTANSSTHWVATRALRDLPTDGLGVSIELEGRRIALFRIGERVHAIDDECPHQGASLGLGVALEGEVSCPWHSWHFELATGRNTDGLAACVAVHGTRVRADGVVEVELARTDAFSTRATLEDASRACSRSEPSGPATI